MRTLTLTILISDLQGYTERQARSSRAAIAGDLERFGALLRPTFAAFDGDVVKSMGDAFLVCFESPTNAVLAAIQVQKQLELHNATLASNDTPMRVRTGIATGEVAQNDDGDVFGDAVNLAARLQSSADPSAIWLAETTFLSMNKNEVQAFEVGARVFKGVPGEVKVYRVLDDCIAATRALSADDLARQLAPLRKDVKRTRRYALSAVALVLALAGGIGFALRDSRPPEQRFLADPTDVASGDRWLDEVAARVFAADEGEIQRLYREHTLDDILERGGGPLRGRPSFERVRLAWGMASAPLTPGLPEEVLAALKRERALRADARFVALLRATVEYAVKDAAAHAVYARALAQAEGG